jgi:hypothetical protein
MSNIVHQYLVRGQAQIVDQPAVQQGDIPEVDRSFGLPAALYGATVGCYLGFLLIIGSALASPGMAIPMAIFVVFILAGFGVPALWTRMRGNTGIAPTLGEFRLRGIMTHTGRLAPRDATVQMLILPVILVTWVLAVAVIAALVR